MDPSGPEDPSGSRSKPLARAAAAIGLVVLLVIGSATRADADAAGPSDFRSEVTGLVPATDGVEARIRGGDAFLELVVEPGVTVVVEGYNGDPYLRFNPDGTVERNRLSPATYLNDDRSGAIPVPEEATAAAKEGAEPDWEQVAEGGTYAWHDHRVHWMSSASPSVSRGEQVPGEYDPWIVPLVVDGARVEVQGSLTYERAVNPILWAVVALLAAAVVVKAGQRAPVRVGGLILAGLSAAAVVVGRADYVATPEGGGNPLAWILPVVALVLSLLAVALARRALGVVALLGAVAALSSWVLLRLAVLTKPVLPSELPAGLDRATVALSLGASIGAAFLAIRSGFLALPALEGDDGAGADTQASADALEDGGLDPHVDELGEEADRLGERGQPS